jgi:hypothetical protein
VTELRAGLPNIDPWIDLGILTNRSAKVLIDRGVKNFSARGQIRTYNSSSSITYNGTAAWNSPVAINSTIQSWTFPLLNNIQVSMTGANQYLNFYFDPMRIVKELQLAVSYMEWSPKNYQQQDAFSPQILGTNNLTRFRNFSWFASLENYYSKPGD